MYFNELKEGMCLKLAPVEIKKDKMLSFAKEYADVPVHTDEEYAKNTHFGKLLAPGMMTFLEVWAKYLEQDLFGEELLAGQSTSVRWFAPVFPGDKLTSTVEIVSLLDRNSKNGLAVLEIKACNQEGTHVLTGRVEAIVKKLPQGA